MADKHYIVGAVVGSGAGEKPKVLRFRIPLSQRTKGGPIHLDVEVGEGVTLGAEDEAMGTDIAGLVKSGALIRVIPKSKTKASKDTEAEDG